MNINPKDLKVKLWKDDRYGYFQVLEQPEEWRGVGWEYDGFISEGRRYKILSRGCPSIGYFYWGSGMCIFLRGNDKDLDLNVFNFDIETYNTVLEILREFGCRIEGNECPDNEHDYVPIEACGFTTHFCRKCKKQKEE
jgi:hypothetical protein